MPGRVVHTKRIRGSGRIRQARLAGASPCECRRGRNVRRSRPCSSLSLPLASAAPGGQADRRTRSSYAFPGCTRADNPTSSSPPRVVLHGGLDSGVEAGVRVGDLPHEAVREEIQVAPCPLVAGPHIRYVEAILSVLRPATKAKPGGRAAGDPDHDLIPTDHLVVRGTASLLPGSAQAIAHAGDVIARHKPRQLVRPPHDLPLRHRHRLPSFLSISVYWHTVMLSIGKCKNRKPSTCGGRKKIDAWRVHDKGTHPVCDADRARGRRVPVVDASVKSASGR